MNAKKTWPYATIISGIILVIIGAALIAGYITEAYFARKGEPDQSLLFWYLPILFIGFITFAAGLSAGIWGFIRLRKIKHNNPANDSQPLY